MSTARFARQKMGELGASKEWANTEQAQPEQGHRKQALVTEVVLTALPWYSDVRRFNKSTRQGNIGSI